MWLTNDKNFVITNYLIQGISNIGLITNKLWTIILQNKLIVSFITELLF